MKNKLITLLLTVLFIISMGFLIYQQREIKSSLSEIQEQSELIENLESEKGNLISEEQELHNKLDSLKNETETFESDITTLTEENKRLSKSIDQSKQNVTQKEKEKAEDNKEVAETTKEVTESNNVSQDFLDKISNLGEGFGGASAFDGVTFGGQATVGDGSGRFSNVNLQ